MPLCLQVSGGLLAAACVQFLLGITGAMGFLLNYIGPLTVAPTVALVGLSLTDGAIRGARHQWGIFALYVYRVELVCFHITGRYNYYIYRLYLSSCITMNYLLVIFMRL